MALRRPAVGGSRDPLGLGEITIQEFGEPTDMLIRVQKQEGDVEDHLTGDGVIEVEYRTPLAAHASAASVDVCGDTPPPGCAAKRPSCHGRDG